MNYEKAQEISQMAAAIYAAVLSLRRVIAGLGYLEGYGGHPGIAPFLLLTSSAFLFGAVPGVVSGLIWGSVLCLGAYERAVDYERSQRTL